MGLNPSKVTLWGIIHPKSGIPASNGSLLTLPPNAGLACYFFFEKTKFLCGIKGSIAQEPEPGARI
jgi:hypothetical protein